MYGICTVTLNECYLMHSSDDEWSSASRMQRKSDVFFITQRMGDPHLLVSFILLTHMSKACSPDRIDLTCSIMGIELSLSNSVKKCSKKWPRWGKKKGANKRRPTNSHILMGNAVVFFTGSTKRNIPFTYPQRCFLLAIYCICTRCSIYAGTAQSGRSAFFQILFINKSACMFQTWCIISLSESGAERGKWNDEWLKGNMVMQDLAFGHWTASSCEMWHFHISYLCLDRVWCIWDYITSDTTCAAKLHVHKCLCLTYAVIFYSRGWLLFCCVYVLFFESWAAWPWRLSCRAYLSLLNRDCFPICCLIISPLQMSHIQPESLITHCIKHLLS